MNTTKRTELVLASFLTLALSAPHAHAQAAPPPGAATAPEGTDSSEEIIELTPFVVSSDDGSKAYTATTTLGGSRVRSDLRDLASSFSVVTSQLMKDLNAKDSQSLLQYTTNTEVGGLAGNYAGVGNTMMNGVADNLSTLVRPSNNTRVRGLDSADNTRDYYLTNIPWDSFNIDRVEVQRGPNSILFGIGSPAGIINASLAQASYKDGGKAEASYGSYGSVRALLDYNRALLKDELALRVIAVDDNTKYRQKPAYQHAKRIFATARYEPEILRKGSARTSIRVNYEAGDVKANRPRTLPPFDNITPFFITGTNEINRTARDPYEAWLYQRIGFNSGSAAIPYLAGNVIGAQTTNNPVFVYNADSTQPINGVYQARPSMQGALGVNQDTGAVLVDNSIAGFPFGAPLGINGYYDYAVNKKLPGAENGFYKNKTLSDPTIFDFFNNLIDGPNKREWQKWNAFNTSVDQTFLNGRLAVQLAYDHQDYSDGYRRNLGWAPAISVDVNAYMMDYPEFAYPGQGVVNPNAGRAYVAGGAQGQGGSVNSKRDNLRAMVYSDIRATDFLDRGLLTDILGTHSITGLVSRDIAREDTRNFAPYSTDTSYTDALKFGATGTAKYRISDGPRAPDLITYLSGDLRSMTSASGLYLKPITAVQNPSGAFAAKYFDATWNAADSVAKNAVWTNPAVLPGGSNASFQTENPANYVGWRQGTFNMLNSDQDLTQLYADITRTRTTVDSQSITWQGKLFNGLVVPTYGWRKDKQKITAKYADTDMTTGAASLTSFTDSLPSTATGETKTWGVVLHSPKKIRNLLPANTNVSLILNDSNNTRVQTRYGFSGNELPNAKGHSRDYGFAVSTLDDRMQFKMTWYETKVTDANLGAGETATLGSNTYYLYLLEAWGIARSISNLAGINGKIAGNEGAWNWALVDNGWDWSYADPNGAPFKNAQATKDEIAASQAFIATMPDQAFFDAYGFTVDVAKAQSGNIDTMLTALGSGFLANPTDIGSVQAAGKGRIRGVFPTGTVTNVSKGVEIELAGQPLKNWNVSVNASKTFSSRDELGADITNWIEKTYTRFQGPAGDIRLWWAGDKDSGTIRSRYLANIYAPYQFQKDAKGTLVPEMTPWRFNVINSYNFDRGFLKGSYVGAAYRWEKGSILGYALKRLDSGEYRLDVDKPFWGEKQDAIDLWVGYGHQLTRKVRWQVQLNVRNVGEKARLVPISVQPDGSPATSRIADGMGWTLTNTFSF